MSSQGPDFKTITNSTTAACCAECGKSSRCGVWFFNGLSQTCFLKATAGPDKVTPPDPSFAAGYSAGHPADEWCTFTGTFQDPPDEGCPAPGKYLSTRAICGCL